MTISQTQPLTAPPAPPARRSLTGISLGYFMVLLDMTVLAVAEPDLATSLHASTAGLQWTTTAYTVTFAALLLAAGAATDRYGAPRLFRAGIVTFTAASLLSTIAPALSALITLRTVMGAAAAVCVPASMAMIARLYPSPPARAKAIATWAATSGAAVAAGPIAGGALVGAAGWRAVFLINVPIGLAVLALTRTATTRTAIARIATEVPIALRTAPAAPPAAAPSVVSPARPAAAAAALPSAPPPTGPAEPPSAVPAEPPSAASLAAPPAGPVAAPSAAASQRVRIDWPAHLAAAAVLAAATDTLIAAGAHQWPHTVVAALLTVTTAVVYATFERRSPAPVLNRRLLREPAIRPALLAAATVNFTLSGILFVLPLLLQRDHHLSALQTGLAFLPLTVPFAANPPLTGRIVARTGPYRPIVAGLTLLTVGAAGSAVALYCGAGYPWLAGALLVTGFGVSSALPALATAVVTAASPSTTGAASGLLNAVRQTGATAGVAVMGAALSAGPAWSLLLAAAAPCTALAVYALPARKRTRSHPTAPDARSSAAEPVQCAAPSA
ncbi:MFS transporter [Dactylosporangium sp. NPDC051541]|uniref:MFS transporter n=1 Tax=Dactylosporangium sp. NPDC051541 TaxID=3363977 RepID=UPI0037A5DCA6